MIEFFNTHYYIDRDPAAVFHFLSDFRHYFEQLPEFAGAGVSCDETPLAPGKIFVVRTENESYKFETHVQILRLEPPQLLAYEYSYRPRTMTAGFEAQGSASAKSLNAAATEESPMPWNRAEVTLQMQPYREGTQVRAQMHIFGVRGFFARWKVAALKSACARQQAVANQNLVQLAERSIPRLGRTHNET